MSAKFVAGTTMNERVGTVYTMAPEVLEESYTEKVRARRACDGVEAVPADDGGSLWCRGSNVTCFRRPRLGTLSR